MSITSKVKGLLLLDFNLFNTLRIKGRRPNTPVSSSKFAIASHSPFSLDRIINGRSADKIYDEVMLSVKNWEAIAYGI